MAHDSVIKAGIEKGDPFVFFSGYITSRVSWWSVP